MMGTFKTRVERLLRPIRMRASWDSLVGLTLKKFSSFIFVRAAMCLDK